MTDDPITRCWLDTCREPAHVVVYATADRLGGRPTRVRQAVAFCLKHGDQIYTVMKQWGRASHTPSNTAVIRKSAVVPNWLVADVKNNRLPRTSPSPDGWPPASALATNKFKKVRNGR